MSGSIETMDVPLLVKKRHELSKLLAAVEKGSDAAVNLIVQTMTASDETVGLKTKLELAKLLLELQIKITDQISKDQLVRQIAEVKLNGLPTGAGGPKRPAVVLDMHTLQDV